MKYIRAMIATCRAVNLSATTLDFIQALFIFYLTSRCLATRVGLYFLKQRLTQDISFGPFRTSSHLVLEVVLYIDLRHGHPDRSHVLM